MNNNNKRDSQVTFTEHLLYSVFHMTGSQSSAITWFHRIQTTNGRMSIGEPGCNHNIDL